MSSSFIYRSPWIYHVLMRCLHGRYFADRYQAIANLIPEGASVVEVGAGDAWLYRHFLRQKSVDYLGLDNAPAFVGAAKASGIPFRAFDLLTDEIPAADYVIQQASLHLFYHDAPAILQRLLDAARHGVIVAEPVRNFADSSNPLFAWLGRRLTRPHGNGGDHTLRFTPETFRQLVGACRELKEVFPEPGGREHIALLRGRATPSS